MALYLTVISASGWVRIRNIAGGITGFVGIMIVLPAIASGLPQTWGDRINKHLPSNAGRALMAFGSDNTALSPWAGFALFTFYALALIAIAAVMLRNATPEPMRLVWPVRLAGVGAA